MNGTDTNCLERIPAFCTKLPPVSALPVKAEGCPSETTSWPCFDLGGDRVVVMTCPGRRASPSEPASPVGELSQSGILSNPLTSSSTLQAGALSPILWMKKRNTQVGEVS